MKIDNQGLNPQKSTQVKTAHALEKPAPSPASAGKKETIEGKDVAALSETARLLARARLALAETADVRPERIADLKSQVESGTYQVPLEMLARQLAARLQGE